MRTVTALVLVTSLVAAGCLDPDPAAVADTGPLPATWPTGCDPDRAPIAHLAGGVPSEGVPPAPLFGCTYRTGHTSLEPTIGITSDGTVFIGPGREAFGPALVYGVLRSPDEGQTWEVVIPDLAGVPTHPTTQDPYLYVDPVTDRVFAEDLVIPPFNCGNLSWTDDGGESWAHSLSGCMQTDHVTIFSGVPVTSTTRGYPNIIYRCAISGGALVSTSTMVVCQRSVDGGPTWLPPGDPAFTFLPGILPGGCSGGNGHGTTDAEGRVYLPRGHCGQPWIAVSDDEAMTWTRVQVSDLGIFCHAGLCEHDAGIAVDSEGTAYYAWVAADRLPYLAVSRDRGLSWEEPRMIGFPGLVETSHIQLIAGAKGRIAFVYLGSSDSPGAPWEGDYSEVTWGGYMGASFDADGDGPTFFTATINETSDPLVRGRCGPVRCHENFDFIDIRIAPDGSAWAPLVDSCTGTCATGETRTNNHNEALAGRLWGVSFWDEQAPRGPYRDG